jgi:hypothetical protein
MPSGQLAHTPQDVGRQSALASLRRDLRGHGAQSVDRAPVSPRRHNFPQGGVDSVRKCAVIPVPRQRTRVRFGEHYVGGVVVEGELVLGQLLEQRTPPVGVDVGVEVVLRPNVLRTRPAVGQVRALGPREQPDAHDVDSARIELPR